MDKILSKEQRPVTNMAKFYTLSEYERITGKRRRTSTQWKKIITVVSACIILEHLTVIAFLVIKHIIQN